MTVEVTWCGISRLHRLLEHGVDDEAAEGWTVQWCLWLLESFLGSEGLSAFRDWRRGWHESAVGVGSFSEMGEDVALGQHPSHSSSLDAVDILDTVLEDEAVYRGEKGFGVGRQRMGDRGLR